MTLTQQFDDFLNVDAKNVEQQKINDDFNKSVDENLKATIEKVIKFTIISFLNLNLIFFQSFRRFCVVAFNSSNLKLNFLARFFSIFRCRAFLDFVRELSSIKFSFKIVIFRCHAFSRLFSIRIMLKSIFESNFRFFIFFLIFVILNDT